MSLVPKHIIDLAPYKAGNSISQIKEKIGLSRVIKLASNENPLGPSRKVKSKILNCIQNINRYPDSSGKELREKLAKLFRLQTENVILGAGSEGIMSAIMRTFLHGEDEIIAVENSFIGFRVLANASGFKINWIPMIEYHHDLNGIVESINSKTKIIYLANPDNPTGTYFSDTEFDSFMKKIPDRVLVILDEAYFEYAQHLNDYPDSMHYRYDNVITLRTFSKIYGLAGLRIGYGFAHHDLISNLMKVKLPFEPSIPAQVAGIAALDDKEYLHNSIQSYIEGMQYMEAALNDKKYHFIDSAANFITIIFKSAIESSKFYNEMLNKGIILRLLSGFGLSNCVRVTIGSKDENKIFSDILNEINLG